MHLDGRYRLDRLLKSSRGADTFLATDHETQAQVVVKVLTAAMAAPSLAMRLEHEASVLARLQEPHLSLIRFDRSDDSVYLVQPYLPGEALAETLKRGALSVKSTLVVAADLLRTLQHAHDLGVLHRDVKPSNVIVQDSEPLEKATLIDFGLSFSASLDPEIRREAVGTARYLAPEQAGLVDRAVDERSDLYSAGILLYECLAGHPPFAGESVGEVLRQHLSMPVPSLRAARAQIPRSLEAVILRLLAK